jgi:uncharacterized Tic20 family protein
MAETNATPSPSGVSKDARMWGMLCHLLGLFTSFVGPLIIWLLKKEEDPFIDDQGKEALNFQITVGIAFIAVGIVPVLLRFLACVTPLLGLAVSVADIVFCIIACIKANGGEAYRYPVAIRFVK